MRKNTLGGSRTPAPCLEGKDDNRFTTSVLYIGCETSNSRGSTPQAVRLVFSLPFIVHTNPCRGLLEGCGPGLRHVRDQLRSLWISAGLTLDQKGKRPVPHSPAAFVMSIQHFGKGALRVAKNYTKGYSDVQAKVRDATSNDPWGPSGTQMNEIAQMTYNQFVLTLVPFCFGSR